MIDYSKCHQYKPKRSSSLTLGNTCFYWFHLYKNKIKNLWLHLKFFLTLKLLFCFILPFLSSQFDLTFFVRANFQLDDGRQTSKITLNWNKKPLTVAEDVSEGLSLKLLWGVTFPSLPGQSDILCFTKPIFNYFQ